MNAQNVMTSHQSSAGQTPCYFFRFGLIVTGKGERDHLPRLFRSLTTTKVCHFEVIRFIGQRSPRSEKRRLKMVGHGKTIPDKDTEEIGLANQKIFKGRSMQFCGVNR